MSTARSLLAQLDTLIDSEQRVDGGGGVRPPAGFEFTSLTSTTGNSFRRNLNYSVVQGVTASKIQNVKVRFLPMHLLWMFDCVDSNAALEQHGASAGNEVEQSKPPAVVLVHDQTGQKMVVPNCILAANVRKAGFCCGVLEDSIAVHDDNSLKPDLRQSLAPKRISTSPTSMAGLGDATVDGSTSTISPESLSSSRIVIVAVLEPLQPTHSSQPRLSENSSPAVTISATADAVPGSALRTATATAVAANSGIGDDAVATTHHPIPDPACVGAAQVLIKAGLSSLLNSAYLKAAVAATGTDHDDDAADAAAPTVQATFRYDHRFFARISEAASDASSLSAVAGSRSAAATPRGSKTNSNTSSSSSSRRPSSASSLTLSSSTTGSSPQRTALIRPPAIAATAPNAASTTSATSPRKPPSQLCPGDILLSLDGKPVSTHWHTPGQVMDYLSSPGVDVARGVTVKVARPVAVLGRQNSQAGHRGSGTFSGAATPTTALSRSSSRIRLRASSEPPLPVASSSARPTVTTPRAAAAGLGTIASAAGFGSGLPSSSGLSSRIPVPRRRPSVSSLGAASSTLSSMTGLGGRSIVATAATSTSSSTLPRRPASALGLTSLGAHATGGNGNGPGPGPGLRNPAAQTPVRPTATRLTPSRASSFTSSVLAASPAAGMLRPRTPSLSGSSVLSAATSTARGSGGIGAAASSSSTAGATRGRQAQLPAPSPTPQLAASMMAGRGAINRVRPASATAKLISAPSSSTAASASNMRGRLLMPSAQKQHSFTAGSGGTGPALAVQPSRSPPGTPNAAPSVTSGASTPFRTPSLQSISRGRSNGALTIADAAAPLLALSTSASSSASGRAPPRVLARSASRDASRGNTNTNSTRMSAPRPASAALQRGTTTASSGAPGTPTPRSLVSRGPASARSASAVDRRSSSGTASGLSSKDSTAAYGFAQSTVGQQPQPQQSQPMVSRARGNSFSSSIGTSASGGRAAPAAAARTPSRGSAATVPVRPSSASSRVAAGDGAGGARVSVAAAAGAGRPLIAAAANSQAFTLRDDHSSAVRLIATPAAAGAAGGDSGGRAAGGVDWRTAPSAAQLAAELALLIAQLQDV